MMKRQRWMDNLRGKVVCLVLLFHVFYYYCACCKGSGIGGFTDHQWQDGVVYVLYPWMMMLLFILAGMSSRYALGKYSGREFIKSRTIKLLVPGTIGLFVWQWMAGYFNVMTVGYAQGIGEGIWGDMPSVGRYLLMAITGGGHLWFIQLLWLFAIITPLLPTKSNGEAIPQRSGTSTIIAAFCVIVMGFLLIWAAEQTVVTLDGASPLALWNTFRPVVYLVCYLLGFYIFIQDSFLDLLDHLRWPLMVLAIAGALLIPVLTWGQDPYSGGYLHSWYNNLYAWIVCLAMIAGFRHWRNKQHEQRWMTVSENYINSASYGLYILHYLIISGVGYSLKVYTTLPAWADYTILFVAVFTLTPLLYELIRRIPVLRWCVLGIAK